MDIMNSMLNGQGIVLLMASLTVQLPPTTWIAYSGVSTHITNEERGLYKKRRINEPISLGNREIVQATIIGKLDVSVEQAGHRAKFTLENVHYIPGFYAKCFSLTTAIKKGCTISNTKMAIIIKKDGFQLTFD